MLSSTDFRRVKLPMCYLGDFPCDQLPPITAHSPPWCLIVNSDKRGESGTHWMCVCRPPQSPHVLLFMDPLALSLHKLLPNLREWLTDQHKVVVLPYPIQPMHSVWCGAYCAFLLYHLPKHSYNLLHLVQIYFSSDDLAYNDDFIKHWWKKNCK